MLNKQIAGDLGKSEITIKFIELKSCKRCRRRPWRN
jgi:hypothetical protein